MNFLTKNAVKLFQEGTFFLKDKKVYEKVV